MSKYSRPVEAYPAIMAPANRNLERKRKLLSEYQQAKDVLTKIDEAVDALNWSYGLPKKEVAVINTFLKEAASKMKEIVDSKIERL